MKRFPDFFCIGVQKAGTTWLFENLRDHPGFWLPFLKEVDYFNYVHLPEQRSWIKPFLQERCARNILQIAAGQGWWAGQSVERRLAATERLARLMLDPIDDEWYARVFAAAGEDLVAGDITPEYSILPIAGREHMLSVSPQAKVVLMLRHPVERDLSHARMVLKDRPEITDADVLRACSFPDIYSRSEYPRIIGEWEALLPKERFLIVFFDHIVTRPHDLLCEISAFLGVPANPGDWPKAGAVIHKGREAQISDAVRDEIRSRHEATLRWMADRFPDPCAAWI